MHTPHIKEEGKKAPKKKKVPTALKRMKQNAKENLRNRSFKSRVRTAIRSFETALSAKDKEKFEADGPNFNLSKLRAEAFADLLTSLGLNVEEAIGGGKGPTFDWDGDGKFDPELGKLNRIVVVEEIR